MAVTWQQLGLRPGISPLCTVGMMTAPATLVTGPSGASSDAVRGNHLETSTK